MKHVQINPDGTVVEITVEDVHMPLNEFGVIATLLAVGGVLSVEDAANAFGLTTNNLIAEAQSWAAAQLINEAQDGD
jgi:hypothetical protein